MRQAFDQNVSIVKTVRAKCCLAKKGLTIMEGEDYDGPCLMGLELEMCYDGSLPKTRCSLFQPTLHGRQTEATCAMALQSECLPLLSIHRLKSEDADVVKPELWEGDYIMRAGSS